MKVTCLNLVGLNFIHKGIKVHLKFIQYHIQIYSIKDYFAIPLSTFLEVLSHPRTPVHVYEHGPTPHVRLPLKKTLPFKMM